MFGGVSDTEQAPCFKFFIKCEPRARRSGGTETRRWCSINTPNGEGCMLSSRETLTGEKTGEAGNQLQNREAGPGSVVERDR